MLDKFDYEEPICPLCDGKSFYYPEADAPLGSIPIERVISKVDSLFNKNDYIGAGRLLEYWKSEAIALKDKRGELAMQSELIGYYRKQNERDKCILSVDRALELVDELGQEQMASGATIFINCATAYKAFGMASDAILLYKKAEAVYQAVLNPTDARFGGLYNNMALALSDLKRYDYAENAYLKALEVMSNAINGEAQSAITYINLAYLYEAMNKTEEIDECMSKARSLLQSENLVHDGYYAFVLEKCAPAFEYFGDSETCNKFKKESKEIYERA